MLIVAIPLMLLYGAGLMLGAIAVIQIAYDEAIKRIRR